MDWPLGINDLGIQVTLQFMAVDQSCGELGSVRHVEDQNAGSGYQGSGISHRISILTGGRRNDD